MIAYRVAYDNGGMSFAVPDGWRVTVARGARAEALDLVAAARAALAAPIRSQPLRGLARPDLRVCIVFTDATRACPDDVLVPLLLAELAEGGVPPQNISLLVATGVHRPSTPVEKAAKLGAEVARQYRIIDHNAGDPAEQASLGHWAGVPLSVNRVAKEADLLIATGVVEPHQYAGYSGGGKTVAIGCAGDATIEATHGPRFLDDPACRLGRVAGNPFQTLVREAAARAGLSFVINVVLDGESRPVAVAAGAPDAVHDALVPHARSLAEVEVAEPFDLAVAGVAAPKDVNLYQASRAITYLALAGRPAVRPGAPIVVAARCREGAGQGVGERNFLEAMRSHATPGAVLVDLRARGCRPGEQRAFMIAQARVRHPLWVAGAEDASVVRACQMLPADSLQAAIDVLAPELGASPSVLVVEDGLHVIPTLP